MPADIRITIEGDQVWTNHLRESSQKARNLRPAFRRLSLSLFRFFRKRFQTGGRYGGTAWRPKAQETARQSRSSKTLVDRGDLRDSFTRKGGYNVLRIDNDSLEFGSSLDYARYHQTGFLQKTLFGTVRKNPFYVPARPILPMRIPGRDGDQWGAELMEYITNDSR